jgi:hypothetical protein
VFDDQPKIVRAEGTGEECTETYSKVPVPEQLAQSRGERTGMAAEESDGPGGIVFRRNPNENRRVKWSEAGNDRHCRGRSKQAGTVTGIFRARAGTHSRLECPLQDFLQVREQVPRGIQLHFGAVTAGDRHRVGMEIDDDSQGEHQGIP